MNLYTPLHKGFSFGPGRNVYVNLCFLFKKQKKKKVEETKKQVMKMQQERIYTHKKKKKNYKRRKTIADATERD